MVQSVQPPHHLHYFLIHLLQFLLLLGLLLWLVQECSDLVAPVQKCVDFVDNILDSVDSAVARCVILAMDENDKCSLLEDEGGINGHGPEQMRHKVGNADPRL